VRRDLATKEDLQVTKDELKADMAELKAELTAVERRLEETLRKEIRGAIAFYTEDFKKAIGVFDDKYKDLPHAIDKLELAVAEHKADYDAHKRPRKPRGRG
jgi:hypothetical protein